MTAAATRDPDAEHDRESLPWFVIELSQEQVHAGHVARIVETFTELFLAAGSPHGAAMFGASHDDGRRDLYLNPPAALLASDLIPANGARPCVPPLDEGGVELLVGHEGDRRLLSS